MITVFADKYLFEIESFLPEEIDLYLYNPEDGVPDARNNMDALLIRTVTKINEHTWQQIPENLRFIGTGSAGTDHVDARFLNDHNITFASAAGCNARSVAEYVATALLLWSDDLGHELSNKKVGIIGMGHVGTEVHSLLKALDVSVICYDPPREEQEEYFTSAEPEEVLSADILTFHTPLTKTGNYPTYHWLDDRKLANHRYDLIINTARGGVLDEQAMQKAFLNDTIQNYIIDVWEDEPVFNDIIAQNAYIKTPHIAGYSKQAKSRASWLIAEALCKYFSLEMPNQAQKSLPGKTLTSLPSPESTNLSEVLRQIHPIKDYEDSLVRLIGLPPKEKGLEFNKLRVEHPLRDEFGFIKVSSKICELFPSIADLGVITKST